MGRMRGQVRGEQTGVQVRVDLADPGPRPQLRRPFGENGLPRPGVQRDDGASVQFVAQEMEARIMARSSTQPRFSLSFDKIVCAGCGADRVRGAVCPDCAKQPAPWEVDQRTRARHSALHGAVEVLDRPRHVASEVEFGADELQSLMQPSSMRGCQPSFRHCAAYATSPRMFPPKRWSRLHSSCKPRAIWCGARRVGARGLRWWTGRVRAWIRWWR